MNKEELKEIIAEVIEVLKDSPEAACVWDDCDDCADCVDCQDVVMYYGILPAP